MHKNFISLVTASLSFCGLASFVAPDHHVTAATSTSTTSSRRSAADLMDFIAKKGTLNKSAKKRS